MYHSRDFVSQGTINLGTRCPRTFVRGHIVSVRPVTLLNEEVFVVEWREVPKRCVPVQLFCDPLSPINRP